MSRYTTSKSIYLRVIFSEDGKGATSFHSPHGCLYTVAPLVQYTNNSGAEGTDLRTTLAHLHGVSEKEEHQVVTAAGQLLR